jgi:hypothetical protein
MADIPEDSYARPWGAGDTRVRPPAVGGERETLSAFLDRRRETFTLKCAVSATGGCPKRGIPPSGLSLHGPLRHLAAVERWWFAVQFAATICECSITPTTTPTRTSTPPQRRRRRRRDVRDGGGRVPAVQRDGRPRVVGGRDRGCGRGPVSRSRRAEALVHMIADYARHNGHADLLRERIDGVTGY